MGILEGAEPFSSDGGPVGVLLRHGFTGCPQTNPLHAVASMLPMYADTVPRLKETSQPLLLSRSTVDHVVPASSTRHVATLDNDAPMIFDRSAEFIATVTSSASAPGGGTS